MKIDNKTLARGWNKLKNMLARIYVADVMVHVNFFLDAQITKLTR